MDVLNIAMFDKFGLTIGTWNIIVGATLIAGTLMLKGKYIQIGTILNGVMVGMLVDFFFFMICCLHKRVRLSIS